VSTQTQLVFGGIPPFVRGSDTSKAAALDIHESAPSIRGRVRVKIVCAGGFGRTCDEIESLMHLRHQTASARIRELVLQGLIEDSGQRRSTRSGRGAIVYVSRHAA
jgi:hypothetical protein